MTIIEPAKNNYIREFLYIGLLILVSAAFSIYFYNLNVNLKYQISLQEKSLQQLEAGNADLKNQLYQIFDSKNLAVIAKKQNLISDKNPDYFEHKSLANL